MVKIRGTKQEAEDLEEIKQVLEEKGIISKKDLNTRIKQRREKKK
jgi:hypothetical protein